MPTDAGGAMGASARASTASTLPDAAPTKPTGLPAKGALADGRDACAVDRPATAHVRVDHVSRAVGATVARRPHRRTGTGFSDVHSNRNRPRPDQLQSGGVY